MTPREYIAQLKAEKPFPNRPEHAKASIQALVESGIIPEDIVAPGASLDFGDHVFNTVRKTLPEPIFELFKSGIIAFGAVYDEVPTVYVERLSDRGYAIVFHSGLSHLIYRIARILATHVIMEPEAERKVPDLRETARLIAENFWWYTETNTPFGPSYPIKPYQMLVASDLASFAEAFFLAHEIGHVVSQYAAEHPSAKVLLEFDSHEEEHLADLMGMHLAMDIYQTHFSLNLEEASYRYAGVEFGLQIYACMEEMGIIFKDTHPKAGIRLRRMREALKTKLPSEGDMERLVSFAKVFENIFAEVAAIVRQRKDAAFFDEQAKTLQEEIDFLLAKCTGGMVPDYFTFYTEVTEIFNRGYPEAILAKVADTYVAVSRDLVNLSGKRPTKEQLATFQKFKLFLGYITGQMTEPAKSIFLAKIDRMR